MVFVYSFSLNIGCENAEQAGIFFAAIKPELSLKHSKRSKTRIMVKKSMLSIIIDSADCTALRATANSLLKKIVLSKSVLEVA